MLIVKLSGKALNDDKALKNLFSTLQEHNLPFILVHGGGVEVDELLQALNFSSSKLNGIRVSPQEHMPYIAAVLSGMCNKLLQASVISNNINALGMLCTDYNMCTLQPYPPEYGMVAGVEPYKLDLIQKVIELKLTPVIASIGIDDKGQLYNVNADEVASALAQLFKAPLVFFSDVKGVLDSKGEIIKSLDTKNIDTLINDGVIKDGMAVKVKSALALAHKSGQKVFIASIFDQEAIANLPTLENIGTSISSKG